MFSIKVINVWRNIRVETVLKQAEWNSKKRIYHVNLDSITLQKRMYENWLWIWKTSETANLVFQCILIKKSTFDLLWNYLTLCERQLASLKKLKMSELKNSKTEVSLKLYLKRIRFIEETIYSRTLHQLPLQMLKVFLSIVDNFKWHFFSVRQS